MQHIHFILDKQEDESYLPILKPRLQGKVTGTISYTVPVVLTQVLMELKARNCKCVATSSSVVLSLLLHSPKKKPSLNDYAGSIIERMGIEFLILPPLKWLATKPEGKFLFDRYLLKFVRPDAFLKMPPFNWKLFDPADTNNIVDFFSNCEFLAVDIETGLPVDREITCCGFTGVSLKNNKIELFTTVIPFTDEYNVAVAAALLALPVAKVTQNGKYDNAYLIRYGMPMANWAYDTQHLFHSWYSELPKRLDFITSFILRAWEYWKDEGTSSNKMEYYRYNAKDCYTTAMVWLGLVAEVPAWAWTNYLAEFPLVFPCLLTELTGLKRDNAAMAAEQLRFEGKLDRRLTELKKLIGNEKFNPSSPPQTLRLLHVLGNKDLKDTTPPSMDKAKFRHPLNTLILDNIIEYRKDRKLVSSYLKDEDDDTGTKSWNGRIFFALNPHGTDTSRLASKESAFWCGWQIQNIPRDRDDVQIKYGIIADEGFYFGECDYAQNEARGTGYLSGDRNLIAAVDDSTKDFHGTNASSFFGIEYGDIVRSTPTIDESGEIVEWVHKTVDKVIRDLAKRTNHGANYNMGAQVMLDTMGIKNVLRAKQLLNLPARFSLIDVCTYLLDRYSATYSTVKGPWYDKVKADIKATKMLVGPTGWTRYCFGDPSSNKRDLNRYVAHPPQSLGAQILNKAYRNVFNNVWMENQNDFRLGPQIHDSILFQYRIGRLDLLKSVAQAMDITTTVVDTFGISRNLNVPVDIKGEANRWSELKSLRLKDLMTSVT